MDILAIKPANTPMTNAGVRNYQATTFCTVVSNICESSGWKFLNVAFMTPRILRFLPDFLDDMAIPGRKN